MIYYVETGTWPEMRDFVGVFEGKDGIDINQLWLDFCNENNIDPLDSDLDPAFKNPLPRRLVTYLESKGLNKISYKHVLLKISEDDY